LSHPGAILQVKAEKNAEVRATFAKVVEAVKKNMADRLSGALFGETVEDEKGFTHVMFQGMPIIVEPSREPGINRDMEDFKAQGEREGLEALRRAQEMDRGV
jgi:hypothetical protein